MHTLIQLDRNIWLHEDTMTLMSALPLRLRMTVVKLASGELWVHSPTTLTAELKDAIDALGSVAFIIGPNNVHHLWLAQWHQAYPEAQLHVSEQIPKKTGLNDSRILSAADSDRWLPDLRQLWLPGVPLFSESVFFHSASQSLIVTDLIQNHSDKPPSGFAGLLQRWFFAPLGFKGVCTAPPLKLGFVVKDQAAFAGALAVIQGWDFNRIIVTHGDIIENDAKQHFTRLSQRFLAVER